jgi:hypothetical protein
LLAFTTNICRDDFKPASESGSGWYCEEQWCAQFRGDRTRAYGVRNRRIILFDVCQIYLLITFTFTGRYARVTDKGGLYFIKAFTILVVDIAEKPTSDDVLCYCDEDLITSKFHESHVMYTIPHFFSMQYHYSPLLFIFLIN